MIAVLYAGSWLGFGHNRTLIGLIRRRAGRSVLAAVLLSVLLGGCGALPPERRLEVTATEMQFTPDRLEARAGEQIFIQLRNRGQVAHSLTVDLPTGSRTVSAEPGVDAILAIPATEAGSYRFYCRVPGHEAQQGILEILP